MIRIHVVLSIFGLLCAACEIVLDVGDDQLSPTNEGEGEASEGEGETGEGEGEKACLDPPPHPSDDEGFAGWSIVDGGTFDDASGWQLTGGVAVVDGAARFDLTGQACSSTSIEREVTFTDEDLHFQLDIHAEFGVAVYLDGVFVTVTPAHAQGAYTVCLPNALRGRTATLRFEMHGSFDFCADDTISRAAVIDDLAIGALPRCGDGLAVVDPGFDLADGEQPSVGQDEWVQDIVTLTNTTIDTLGSWYLVHESRGGFGIVDEGCASSSAMRLELDSPCDTFTLHTTVVLPPRTEGPLRLRMSLRGPLSGAEAGFGVSTLRRGLVDKSFGQGVVALGGDFEGFSACVPATLQDTVADVSIGFGGGGGTCALPLESVIVIDDVDLVVDPTCE
jgi:hypothetical protein